MRPELEEYRAYFKDCDLPEDQEAAMIEALWRLAESIADLAFGVHPSQHSEIANDNDSPNKSNVLNFFEKASKLKLPDDYERIVQELEAEDSP